MAGEGKGGRTSIVLPDVARTWPSHMLLYDIMLLLPHSLIGCPSPPPLPAHTESQWACNWSDQLNMVALTEGHLGCDLRFCLSEASFRARSLAALRTSRVGALKAKTPWNGTENKAHRGARSAPFITKRKPHLEAFRPDPAARQTPCGPEGPYPAVPFLSP